MVIGNGLLANALSRFSKDADLAIFAAGVSNSVSCTLPECVRERERLAILRETKCRLIYFSTCSISDPELAESPYVLHKRSQESYISDHFERFLILRLPTVVGRGGNPNTLFNAIYSTLRENQPVTARLHAERYLFDVDDLADVLVLLLKWVRDQDIIDACWNNRAKITDIISHMRSLMASESPILQVEGGGYPKVDNQRFLTAIGNSISSDRSSFFNILSKYVRLRLESSF